MVTATVDLDEVISYRGAISSFQDQASAHRPHPHIAVPFRICSAEPHLLIPTTPVMPCYHSAEEEIALGGTHPSLAAPRDCIQEDIKDGANGNNDDRLLIANDAIHLVPMPK